MSETPIRLPDAATVDAVLAGLNSVSADSDLAPALSATFPGFTFSTSAVDDFYWRDARTVLTADGARFGSHREWVERELAAHNGDLAAVWNRHRDSGLCLAEWRGTAVFAFAPTDLASISSRSRSAVRSECWPGRSSIPTTAPGAQTIS